MLKILVVEDDYRLREIIVKNLEKNGYEIIQASNGEIGYQMFEENYVDLIITDIMMPRVDGNTLVKRVRYLNKDIPIIMLTALESYYDKEKSYNNGADDYMVKPVNMKELLLRIKALLKRYKIVSENIFDLGNLHMDYKSKTCLIKQNQITLTIKEFDLLYKLLSSPNQIFTREQLLNEIWGYDSESYERTVDTHIKRIREKISIKEFEIITVRGLGYKVVIK
ncbi:response regulator transcription factor [Candidatus Izemoplasma sp. B36]|uniref:response regulator transcription factor n=1 Tax=Candidatus Izemoplasma sp. B36 TaxID=3242468 RepID=UPI0035587FEF